MNKTEKGRLLSDVQQQTTPDSVSQALLKSGQPEPDFLARLLVCAAQHGKIDWIECLVENGADVNQSWSLTNTTPLLAAIKSHQNKALQKLLQLGADPSQNCPESDRPLTAIAKSCGNEEAFNILETAIEQKKDSPPSLFCLAATVGVAVGAAIVSMV